jgi:endonuclease G
MEIYQPARAVWNGPNQRVAQLSRHAMGQGLDAAVARMTGDRPIINHQHELGPVNGVTQPERGLRVVKSGRTTGVTYGVITGVDGYRVENYDGRRQVIRNIIHIAQSPEGGAVSSAGDSGSIWMEHGANRAVGLHFAGSDTPEYGLALAMPQVLDALQVTLAPT